MDADGGSWDAHATREDWGQQRRDGRSPDKKAEEGPVCQQERGKLGVLAVLVAGLPRAGPK